MLLQLEIVWVEHKNSYKVAETNSKAIKTNSKAVIESDVGESAFS